jgi:hypothetical protein
MRKLTLLVAAPLILASASSAHAALIAGWDFSQYVGSGFLSTDGSAPTNTLDANYSALDPSFGAGAESAAFGRMTALFTPSGSPTDALIPVANSLTSNITAPAPRPQFDSHSILSNEGQQETQFLSLQANQSVSIVFEADLSTVSESGKDWVLTLGAKTRQGVSAGSIQIEFSADGTAYASVGSFALNGTDTLFSQALASGTSDRAFVRLTLSNGSIIDNVAILGTLAVPEPSIAALLAGGLLGLLRFGRRRSA